MTFEELKFLIVDTQRKIEINKLFHLFVKAETYSDILRIVKSEGNYRWIFQNGFRELIQYFPVEELENEGFYNREVTLNDILTDIIVLEEGILNLTQNGGSRCRVICDGSKANIVLNDRSMVEIESYKRSIVYMNINSWSYGYITARDTSYIHLFGNDTSTFMLNGWGYSSSDATLTQDSYINAILNDNALLKTNTQNFYAKQNDKAKINP